MSDSATAPTEPIHEGSTAPADDVPMEVVAPKRRTSQLVRGGGADQREDDSTANAAAEHEVIMPKKRASALGEQRPRKTPSVLQRLNLAPVNPEHPDENMPPRSPVGAIRHVSGLAFRPKPDAPPGGAPAEGTAVVPVDAWHSWALDEVFTRLKTRMDGLTTAEHDEALKVHGLNKITPPKKRHWMIKFLLSLVEGFQLMMNVGSVLCFIVFGISGGKDSQTLVLGIMLLAVAFLTSIFTTYQEGKADKIMEELARLAADDVYVYRNGELVHVPADQLVPGDIVSVKAGDKVPADLRVIHATDLKVNNASLTGENVDIKLGPDANAATLYEAKNVARSGCNFTSGNGVGVVFATGDNTFFGQIAKSTVSIERPDTLMKRQINRLIIILGIFASCLGLAFFLLALFNGFTWIEAVAFGIGIIVANVPEGLLSQLVVTLAITAKKLQKVDVLVSNLEIIETLGAVTVICSDKTGTLTCNRMTVAHCMYDGEIRTVGIDVNREGDAFREFDTTNEVFKTLQRVVTLNTDAVFIEASKKKSDDVLQWEAKGDASETALIKFVQPLRDIVEFRSANPRIAAIPFNSSNKWMISINKNEEAGKPTQILLKGAPERVLAMCSRAHKDGAIVEMDATAKKHFEELNFELASRGERVLAFAYHNCDPAKFPESFTFDVDAEPPNFPIRDFTLVGFLALIDPPRPTVRRAVQECHAAGIKVFMVTGDHPTTAVAISRAIGLIKNKTKEEMIREGIPVPENYRGAIAVHGTEMEKFDQDRWDEVLEHEEIVFARTMPQQKQDIVQQLNRKGHIVAMTGDGVNDAPALKAANVGVAMGSGASVAKEAAQIIVMKDDFGSIVEGIRAGRLVFAAMKKVIMYVLASNTPEIIPFLLYVAAKIPLGIETLIILVIDLGTDILPAIAMAYEDQESQTMKKPPRGPNDNLVGIHMITLMYTTIGLIETLTSYFAFFWVLIDYGFPFKELFGAGLGFRAEFDDLDDDRKDYFEHDLCPKTDKFYARGLDCRKAFTEYRQEALGKAQAAFFVTVVFGQIANILIRKTFTESILSVHRFTHNRQLLYSFVFEICLMCFLVYVPGVNGVFLLHWIEAEYFFCALWTIPLLVCYDELRKAWVRTWPTGLVQKVTDL